MAAGYDQDTVSAVMHHHRAVDVTCHHHALREIAYLYGCEFDGGEVYNALSEIGQCAVGAVIAGRCWCQVGPGSVLKA